MAKPGNIRLLHLIKQLDIGGIERSTIDYSNRLASRLGWIGIFAAEGRYSRSSMIDPAVHFLPSRFPPQSLLFFPITLFQIFTSLRLHGINTVHYHHRIFLAYVIFIRLFFPRVKIVYTHHNCFHDRLTQYLLADIAICPSTGTAEDFRQVNRRPCTIIPHGAVLRDPIPQGNPADEKRLGYIGRIEKEKGVMTLLDAFTSLHRADPAYRLIFRGSGRLRPLLEKEISARGLSGAVRFEGPFVELEKLYQGIDLDVLPSISLEGFGLSILEGIARGIPVVATSIAGITDIIRDGIDGSLVPPGDPDALCRAIANMFDNAAFREKCISEARKRLQELFGIELAVQRYEQCYISLFS